MKNIQNCEKPEEDGIRNKICSIRFKQRKISTTNGNNSGGSNIPKIGKWKLSIN